MPRRGQGPKVPTGRPYGAAQELERQQSQMPVAQAQPLPSAAPPPPAAPAADPMAAAMAMVPPEGLFTQPSDNPMATATHGLPIGAGPGPEALPDPRTFKTIPSDQWLIAQYLPTLEAVANSDGGSAMMRQLVRQLRGNQDPRVTQAALVQRTQGADYGSG